MNNDIEILTPDWLEDMVSFANQKEIGAVGARLWYPHGVLQHAGVLIGPGGVAGHAFLGLPKDNPGYFHRAVLHQSYSAVTAACLVIRKSIFDELGGLDESLAVAFNDVDFCLRVLSAGYRNVWTPYAQMVHHESASRGQEDTLAKRLRFEQEKSLFRKRWTHLLGCDPAYSLHLSLDTLGFEFAAQSRAPQF
jgi:GT2 family glycosyltransferase